jgi:hypothetical protein
MNNRLKDIIQYKTGGKQTAFASLMGWSPQYLAKLVGGGNFGLQPALTILEKCPDIDARWFLLGDGTMLQDDKKDDIRRQVMNSVQTMLDIDRFVPVMSPEELRQFEEYMKNGVVPVFSPDTVAKWEELISERKSNLDAKFKAANIKSDILCRQKTAKK